MRFWGELERVRVEVLLSPAPAAIAPAEEEGVKRPDRLLTTKQVHERTGMSCWWIRQNKATLPIVPAAEGWVSVQRKRAGAVDSSKVWY